MSLDPFDRRPMQYRRCQSLRSCPEPLPGPVRGAAAEAKAAHRRLHRCAHEGVSRPSLCQWHPIASDCLYCEKSIATLCVFVQTIPYDDLQQQLEISSLRELEDLIITHCFYPQLVKGKLDQKQHCLQVWARLSVPDDWQGSALGPKAS